MSAKPDGGPAFPIAADGAYIPDCEMRNNPPAREFPGHPGMTLRDWFAGQALPRLPFDPISPYAAQAKQAYKMADAMIAERDK